MEDNLLLKDEGGLGTKDLGTQNRSLLLKSIHKLAAHYSCQPLGILDLLLVHGQLCVFRPRLT